MELWCSVWCRKCKTRMQHWLWIDPWFDWFSQYQYLLTYIWKIKKKKTHRQISAAEHQHTTERTISWLLSTFSNLTAERVKEIKSVPCPIWKPRSQRQPFISNGDIILQDLMDFSISGDQSVTEPDFFSAVWECFWSGGGYSVSVSRSHHQRQLLKLLNTLKTLSVEMCEKLNGHNMHLIKDSLSYWLMG